MNETQKKPIVLCIMDGWGINKNPENNAVALANTPNVDFLTKTFSYATLDASGKDVGLPSGQVGNSEVGHMNIGAGRVVQQDLPRLNDATNDGSLTAHPALQDLASHTHMTCGLQRHSVHFLFQHMDWLQLCDETSL